MKIIRVKSQQKRPDYELPGSEWSAAPVIWVTVAFNPDSEHMIVKAMTIHTFRRYLKMRLAPMSERKCIWCAERDQPCRVKDKTNGNRYTYRWLQFEKRVHELLDTIPYPTLAAGRNAFHNALATRQLKAHLQAAKEFGLLLGDSCEITGGDR